MMSTSGPSPQRSRQGEKRAEEAKVWLEAARTAARRGNRPEARRLLLVTLHADPRCAEAWFGLAWLAETRSERERLLRQVLALEPTNVRAQEELARLLSPGPSEAKAASATRERSASSQPANGRGARQEKAGGEGGLLAAPTPSVGVAPPSATARQGARRRGTWPWAVAAVLVALGVLGLLALGPIRPTLATLLPSPTPTVIPTPTASPAQIAARFMPQLETALSSGAWPRALEIVTIMRSLAPADEAVRGAALKTYLLTGMDEVRTGRPEFALLHFGQAVEVAPGDEQARLWRETTQAYLTGRQALDEADWPVAIQSFLQVQAQIPDYADASARLIEAYQRQGQAAIEAQDWTAAIESLTTARSLSPQDTAIVDSLALAYRERGILRQNDGDLGLARADLEAALGLWPGDAKTKTHLDEVMYELFPPKRIEIDISTQRLYAYAGDKLVFKYVVSTGLPGRDTAAGRFKVQSKLPMAWSAVWQLHMPYWLGIYYVGTIENGIHALPIRPDGSVMWAGLLGQKASYGCVILDNAAARALYEWAEIGTPVWIHY